MALYNSNNPPQNTGASRTYSDERSQSTGRVEAGLNRYSDLNLQMNIHPQKKDIIAVKGELAVKNAVRNLLLTNFYERPFNSGLGSNLRGLLFEPADTITELAIKNGIQKVLELHEPRIENINIIVKNIEDNYEYRVVVVFSIKANDTIEEVEVKLRRLR